MAILRLARASHRPGAMTTRCPEHMLVVEDNPADARLVQEVLAEVAPAMRCEFVRSAEEARRCLQDGALPDLVLLDHRLHDGDSMDLLKGIRADQRLQVVPVIVLGGSLSPADARRIYVAGANAVCVKANQLDLLADQIRAMVEFWCHVSFLPSEMASPASAPS